MNRGSINRAERADRRGFVRRHARAQQIGNGDGGDDQDEGMMVMPRYPSTSPVIAMPRPPMRPADLRISESEIWPRMIAAMEAGRKNVKIPQTRLAMALPLVGGLPSSGGGVGEELPGTARDLALSLPRQWTEAGCRTSSRIGLNRD